MVWLNKPTRGSRALFVFVSKKYTAPLESGSSIDRFYEKDTAAEYISAARQEALIVN